MYQEFLSELEYIKYEQMQECIELLNAENNSVTP